MPNTKINIKQKEKLKFKPWVQQKFIPWVSKIGNQRYLASIRDAFGTMIPLIIAGSIGILINAIIFGGAGSGYVSLLGLIAKAANPNVAWGDLNSQVLSQGAWAQTTSIMGYAFGVINTATVGMMALWFSFLFGYYISISRNFKSPLIAGLVSGASFAIAILGEVKFFMDAKGLITAIIFGIISTELFVKLSNIRSLNIKLPDGVPPAVGKSFAVFIPACITLSCVALINIIFLTPAIVTQDLKVTTSAFATLNNNSFLKLFDNNFDATTFIKNNPSFGQYSTLLNELQTKFNAGTNNTNIQQFIKFYNDQSLANQSVITNVIGILSGHSTEKLIASIDTSASLKITSSVVNGNNIYVASVQWLQVALGPNSFGAGAAIYQFITSWFISFATGKGGIGIAVVYVFFVSFFWFFGIHGSNILDGIFAPIWWMILGINTNLATSLGYDAAYASGGMGVFAKPFFDAYMSIGGAGSTLALLITGLSVSKRKDLREVAKYATPAGVFQINEPVIFGVPLILNPIYLVPFFVTPLVGIFTGWIFSPEVLNFVKYSYVATPWSAPWFLSATISTLDIKALVPAFISFGLNLLIYLPFVLLDNKLYFKKLKKENIEQYEFEMKYYNDKEFKWNTDTQSKYEAKIEKGNIAISHAEETNEFLDTRIKDKDKLEAKKKKIMDKAIAKQNKCVEDANKLKTKREEKAIRLKPIWEKQKMKKQNKMEKIK